MQPCEVAEFVETRDGNAGNATFSPNPEIADSSGSSSIPSSIPSLVTVEEVIRRCAAEMGTEQANPEVIPPVIHIATVQSAAPLTPQKKMQQALQMSQQAQLNAAMTAAYEV